MNLSDHCRFRQPFYRILLTTNLEFTNTLLVI